MIRLLSCVLAVSAALAGCQSAPTPSWPMPEGVAAARVNGYPLAYQTSGSGPTVVLVSGILCDYRCSVAQVKGLVGDFKVVAVSLRHSYPEKWDGTGHDFSVAQHAADLAAFIEQLEPPVYLVGHSYGAHVSYVTARARPELIRKLVLVEAPLDSLVNGEAEGNDVQRDRAAVTESRYRSGDYDGGLQYALDDINGAGMWAKLPPPVKQLLRDNAWTVVALGKDTPAGVRCSDFGALKMPVLIVHGANTTPRFQKIVQEQSKCLPSAQTATISNAGHGSPYENATDFNAAVTSFLK